MRRRLSLLASAELRRTEEHPGLKLARQVRLCRWRLHAHPQLHSSLSTIVQAQKQQVRAVKVVSVPEPAHAFRVVMKAVEVSLAELIPIEPDEKTLGRSLIISPGHPTFDTPPSGQRNPSVASRSCDGELKLESESDDQLLLFHFKQGQRSLIWWSYSSHLLIRTARGSG